MICEYKGDVKRVYRVDPRKAGRLTWMSACSADALEPTGARTGGSFRTEKETLRQFAGRHRRLPVGFPSLVSPDWDAYTRWRTCGTALLCVSLCCAASWATSSRRLTGQTVVDVSVLLPFWMLAASVFVQLTGQLQSSRRPRWWPGFWLSGAGVFESNPRLYLFLASVLKALSILWGLLYIACSPGSCVSRAVLSVALLCAFLWDLLRRGNDAALAAHFLRGPQPREASAASGTPAASDLAMKSLSVGGGRVVFCLAIIASHGLRHWAPVRLLPLAALVAAVGELCAGCAAARSLTFYHLNPGRMELCLSAFYAMEASHGGLPTNAHGHHTCAGSRAQTDSRAGAATGLDISPRQIGRQEQPWTLPALGPFRADSENALERVFSMVFAALPSLRVNLRVGSALSDVLLDRVGVSTRCKTTVIQHVHEALVCDGVALLYDEDNFMYYALLPETYTAAGVATSWAPLHREKMWDSGSGAEAAQAQCVPPPREGPVWQPLCRRLLWAYFYAYSHQRATGFVGSKAAREASAAAEGIRPGSIEAMLELRRKKLAAQRALTAAAAPRRRKKPAGDQPHAHADAVPPLRRRAKADPPDAAHAEADSKSSGSSRSSSASSSSRGLSSHDEGAEDTATGTLYPTNERVHSPIYVIRGLRADGVLDLRSPELPATGTHPSNNPQSELPSAAESTDAAALPEGSPSCNEQGAGAMENGNESNGLTAVFERFLETLARQGWDLSEFSIPQEGFTVSIEYV